MANKSKRLSPAQRRVLELMTGGGRLFYWNGLGGPAHAYVDLPNGMKHDINSNTAFALARSPWLVAGDGDWRRTVYKLTDAGRAALGPADPAPTEPVRGQVDLEQGSAGRAGDQVTS